MITRRFFASLLTALACTPALALAADDTAPAAGPYRLVVGFPPGGALDTLARTLAEELRVTLNEAVVVENRPGASTLIAIENVKNARPDGKTVLLGAMLPFFMFPMTYEKLNYDFDKDFVSVAGLANVPSVVSTSPGQPYKTIGEYAEWLRRNPTQASVGLTNLGGALHFAVLGMAQATGVTMVPVTYKGGAPLATDLMAGHIPLGTDALAGQLELHRSGRIRILGVTGTRRVHWLPDVPTLQEGGVDSFAHANNLYGAFVPARTPPGMVRKLEAAVLAAMQSRSVQARLDQIGLEPAAVPGATMTRMMGEERSYWAPIVKASGFKASN